MATGKNKRLLITFMAVQTGIGSLTATGVFLKSPHLFPVLILITALLVTYSMRKINRQALNENILIMIHILRVPVELILLRLFLEKKIPELMTFSGWNFDIIIGISAMGILLYKYMSKKQLKTNLMIAWNITGLLFLLFIIILSVLSSPLMIQQLAFDQPNIGVAEFPYCFLPTCVVPVVLMSHLLILQSYSKTKQTDINKNLQFNS